MLSLPNPSFHRACAKCRAVTMIRNGRQRRIELPPFLNSAIDCGLEFESARNLDDTVQSTAADGVRFSDLTESWTVDIEDGVAGSIYRQTWSKNSGQKVSVIQNIECVRTDLETHPLS
jgi:hypothetical protein